MKNLILILLIGFIGNANARILEKWYPQIVLQSSTKDATLKSNQAKYTFEFSPLDGSTNQMVYSIDGIQYTKELANHTIEVLTTPGKHIFQFYYTENYYEVYSDSLQIKEQFHSVYEVRMERADIEIMVDKPVIYLYPETPTKVELKVNPTGKSTFFYPTYTDSWKFTAQPTGELQFGESTYNYLFWEAAQNKLISPDELKTGFIVKKENVVAFLEEKLTVAGLNSKEQADFITYWGPRLIANPLNFVRFEFNKACDRYAELDIEPKPDEIYRIYMSWMAIENEFDVKNQEIEVYERSGFSVLEWGGYEIQAVSRKSGHAVK